MSTWGLNLLQAPKEKIFETKLKLYLSICLVKVFYKVLPYPAEVHTQMMSFAATLQEKQEIV